jgi:electron transfer flavoprotein beta subunit
MKIVVCVKQVLDPRGMTVNRKAEKIFINREEYIVDPASKAALEAASSLKADGVEVIAISVGTDRVDDALREAMARGADRAILIRSDSGDGWVVANLIAAAIAKIGEVDLVLCGDRSLDTGAGELAARLAETLDRPQVSGAAKIEMNGALKAIAGNAEHEGFVEVEVPLPAVVSIVAEAFTGAHANGWRLMDAYKKWAVEAWSTADLDLGEDDLRLLTSKKEDAFPPERQPGTPVRDVKELVVMLKREKLIA